MEREIKIGMSVIGVLLTVFVGLVVKRVHDAYAKERDLRPPAAAPDAAALPRTATVLQASGELEGGHAVQPATWAQAESAVPPAQPRYLPDPLSLEREAAPVTESRRVAEGAFTPAPRFAEGESAIPETLAPEPSELRATGAAPLAADPQGPRTPRIERFQGDSWERPGDDSPLSSPRQEAQPTTWNLADGEQLAQAESGASASRYGESAPPPQPATASPPSYQPSPAGPPAQPSMPRYSAGPAAAEQGTPTAAGEPKPLQPLAAGEGETPTSRSGNAAAYYDSGPRPLDPRASAPARAAAPAERNLPAERITPVGGNYTVAPNDNYWIISQKAYGSGGFFKALAAANREVSEDGTLNVGDTIKIPSEQELRSKFPGLCPKARRPANVQLVSSNRRPGQPTYTVQPGDTMFEIARWELGDAERWYEIYLLNRDRLGDDFHYLPLGFELLLPHDDADQVDPIARRQE